MPSERAGGDREIVALDLFCGAGGFSEGLSQACADLGYDLRHAAINHWDPAIETHALNHPDALQYHSKVEQLHPPAVIDDLVDEAVTDVHTADVNVDLLLAGPECTHFSAARGGKPVNEQKRMSPWLVLDWLEKLDVEAFLVENVKEICFPEDSMVLTENGPVPIQDVEVGTRVLTHKGRWKEVTDKAERTGDIVSVTGRGNRLVRCTPNHELYAREIDAKCWGGKRGRHVQELGEPEWVPAEELVPESETTYEERYEGYYWATPRSFAGDNLDVPEIPKTGRNPDTIPAEDASEAFWRMVGLWLGDGWLDNRPGRENPPHRIRIAGQHPELQAQLESIDWLSWNQQVRKQTDTFVYEASCTHLAHWMKEQFNEHSDGKTIPAWVFGLPEEHRVALVEGYQQADGSVDSNGRCNALTASKQLALGVKHLLESLDVSASLPAPVEPEADHHKTKYYITWDWDLQHEDNDDTTADGYHRWTRVIDVEADESGVTVYDLTVEDDHSFVVDGVVAHNCDWGPVDDGEPTRDGTVFDAWVNALNQLGYSVNWTTLNAAAFGDPTSRNRFFLAGRQGGKATFPEPTHSDEDDDLPDRRTAAEIIDWSDLGSSIWTRDITEPRVHTPPKGSTMERIAEGIRRHCDARLEPFADVLADLGRDEIRHLRDNRVVPPHHADLVARTVDDPFLVRIPAGGLSIATPYLLGQHSNSVARDVTDRPVPTVATGGSIQLCAPEACLVKYYNTSPPQSLADPLDTVTATGHKYALSTTEPVLLRQQDGGHPWSIHDRPVPTIPTKGGHAIATPSLVMPKNYPQRGLHSNALYEPDDRPFHTVTSDPRAKLVSPSLIRYSHGGAALDIDDPMPTIATERGGVFALSSPYLTPLYNGRAGQRPRSRPIDRPLMTVPASKRPAALTTPFVRPFIDDCQGPPQSLAEPLNTQPGSDRYALVVPDLWPWGLDIKYRMLQPDELKQAQGFPPDYKIVGTKEERTEQIGNAVPVHLATALCKHILTDGDPSLASFGGGLTGDADADIPDYEEVLSDD